MSKVYKNFSDLYKVLEEELRISGKIKDPDRRRSSYYDISRVSRHLLIGADDILQLLYKNKRISGKTLNRLSRGIEKKQDRIIKPIMKYFSKS